MDSDKIRWPGTTEFSKHLTIYLQWNVNNGTASTTFCLAICILVIKEQTQNMSRK